MKVVSGSDLGSTTIKTFVMPVQDAAQPTGLPTYGAPVFTETTTLGVLTPDSAFPGDELHSVEWHGQRALVGRRTASFGAKPSLSGTWYDDPSYPLFLITGLGTALNAINAPERVTVACLTIGFPALHISRGAEFARMLTAEPQTITVDGVIHIITIERCETITQPQAAIASQLCHRNGATYRADKEFVRQSVLLYDLGGKTGDRAAFNGSIPNMMQGCEQDGLLHYLAPFQAGIFTLTGASIDDTPTLLQAWTEKSIWHDGETHDLSVLVDDLAAEIVRKDITPHLRLALAALQPRPDRLLLAGGGVIHLADALRDALRKEFRHGITLTTGDDGQPNPRTAVPEGMLKWSVIKFEQALREGGRK